MPFFRRKRIDWRIRGGREIETSIWRHVLWGVLLMSAIIALLVAVWYFTRLSAVTIGDVQIEGGETITHDEVRAVVDTVLRGSYFRVVPYTFSYTIPLELIMHTLESIPRIRDVHIERISKNAIRVKFGEYIPAALWCASIEEFAECYFLDDTGYAFSIAPPLRGGSLIRHIVEGTERLDERQLFSNESYGRMTEFIQALESEFGFRIASVTHTKSGDSTYRMSGGGDILVVSDLEVASVLDRVKAIMESKEFKHLAPGNFRYIDLRFGNKVFVNEELVTATTTGEESILSE